MNENVDYATARHASGGGERRHDRSMGDAPAAIVIFVISIGGALLFAWTRRDDGLINPEHGVGYALGIVGALLMLALLLYPLRKRLKSMREWGKVSTWFRLHMILGVIGPALIILHSNYQVQSMNAAVALTSMLFVAGSGLVGRYLYARIHRGLYGTKIEARELLAEAVAGREAVGRDLEDAQWRAHMADLERAAAAPARGFFAAVFRAVTIDGRVARSRRIAMRAVESSVARHANVERWPAAVQRQHVRDAKARIDRYFASVRRATSLSVYERLFAAWHVLHLPLFVLLIITATIHVVAVNFY